MRHYWLTSDAPDLPLTGFRKRLGGDRPSTLEKGGKGGGSAPSYPDPQAVANATTQTNEATAAYNKALNLNNYSNPFGSQNTYLAGRDPNTGAPIYNTTVDANPQLQSSLTSLLNQAGYSAPNNTIALNGLAQLQGQYQGLNGNLQGLQGQYAGINKGILGLGSQLNQGQAAQAQQQGQNAAYAAQTQYLDPQFSQQQESLQAQLANQGITPGSQAYNNAMLNFNNQKQQAYSNAQNQSILTGSQIGAQNLQNQIAGINTQAGLFGQAGSNLGQQAGLYGMQGSNLGAQAGLYGQQVGIAQLPYSNLQTIGSLIPGYSGTSQSAASPADISGLYNNQYQSQLAGYNAGQSSSNSLMSGLFGLGSAALLSGGGSGGGLFSSFMSDRRAKRDIKRVGTWENGLGVYTYRYVGGTKRHIGFMADEVRKIAPSAVTRFADGFDRVNYVLAVR